MLLELGAWDLLGSNADRGGERFGNETVVVC